MPKDRKQAGAKPAARGQSQAHAAAATSQSLSSQQRQQQEAQQPPAWPIFKPTLPVSDLSLDTIVPGKVVVLHNFFPRSLCRDYVAFLKTLPLVTTPARPKKGEAVRQNDRFQVNDPDFAARLWLQTGLKEALTGKPGDDYDDDDDDTADGRLGLWGGDVVGLSPNIRVYRYTKGQHFAPHYDDSNTLTLDPPPTRPQDAGTNSNSSTISKPPSVAVRTTWTLLLYLTGTAGGDDQCSGGETVFYPNDRVSRKEEIAVAPQTGLLLLHKHGNDCMLHEGREVTSGEKWVIRSDLCVTK
ncbi:hypothetical protein MCOR27_005778 [Pyricularia oryzae]|uniref:Fe2OG dioxygenase domain-containing protein n=1 Tax=Pyricularia grisea TaxID=148305 RepID=A0ABQ8NZG3_PYRGI|nr:hypothetical protein MCOR01_009724 [Pyricularia oryzae]KAI6304307.1 hypothetical protein MCOR33_000618 [Pyricularia grisea]KAH9436988.1 hypothetical protein MCOR02_000650 [Pyricularia oryzae]KAI6260036.1 hypothetical protein MCOR19_003652 [Pyricularia oryzae]KAI6278026.1 hypothetical protein MCOR27_005778 [Pyricularia oryzae]